MKRLAKEYDAVVIGAGIFGLYTAEFLASRGLKVALLEKEKSIFSRASRVNQSRVHRGYHYPRSVETAVKVAEYYDRFCSDFNFALLKNFKEYYAISKSDSMISAQEFCGFCKKVNIPLNETSSDRFFKDDKIEATFEVEEACFNFTKIKDFFAKKINKNKNIDLYVNVEINSVKTRNSKYEISLKGSVNKILAKLAVNTTYSGVNDINRKFGFQNYDLKFELCEIMVCKTKSPAIKNKGVIVMDGPFFSVMPFENGDLVSLYSVNHAPIHTSYIKAQIKQFYSLVNKKQNMGVSENWNKMISQAKSYLRDDIDLRYVESMYEIRPIFVSTEDDDSRPTVITNHSKDPSFFSVLSGKISTIYDVPDVLKSVIG